LSRYSAIRQEMIEWGLDLEQTRDIIRNINLGEDWFEVASLLFVEMRTVIEISLYRRYICNIDNYNVFIK